MRVNARFQLINLQQLGFDTSLQKFGNLIPNAAVKQTQRSMDLFFSKFPIFTFFFRFHLTCDPMGSKISNATHPPVFIRSETNFDRYDSHEGRIKVMVH